MLKINSTLNQQLSLVLGFIILTSAGAQARPEYAAEANIVNCGTCHVNPNGGGARTEAGKLYGSRDYKTAWFSKQDVFSMDMRGQEYLVERTPPANSQSKGLMLMNVIATANLPIAPEKEAPAIGQLVASYNFAPVGPSLREGYYMVRLSPAAENSWFSTLIFGDFMAPFGLMTDEHRTYTKQMVAMSNRDFESGVMMSGTPTYLFHYDLALTSGFSNGGLGTDTHPDSWAVFGNVRHQLGQLPIQLGLSYALENTTAATSPLSAYSLYGVFAFNRYTGPHFNGNIQAEAVSASGWNNTNYATTAGDGIGYFIPTTASSWQTALLNSNSFGWNTLINWDLNRHWTIQYKYEQFVPDVTFQGDSFYRSGGGLKYYFNSNANLMIRYDHGYVNRPGLQTTDLSGIKAIGDTYLAMLHVWL